MNCEVALDFVTIVWTYYCYGISIQVADYVTVLEDKPAASTPVGRLLDSNTRNFLFPVMISTSGYRLQSFSFFFVK